MNDDTDAGPIKPPDPDEVYRHYLETCRRIGIEPVPRDRADELMREWSAAIYAQIKPWARGRHVKTPAHNER